MNNYIIKNHAQDLWWALLSLNACIVFVSNKTLGKWGKKDYP